MLTDQELVDKIDKIVKQQIKKELKKLTNIAKALKKLANDIGYDDKRYNFDKWEGTNGTDD